jgi:hypothetical protein
VQANGPDKTNSAFETRSSTSYKKSFLESFKSFFLKNVQTKKPAQHCHPIFDFIKSDFKSNNEYPRQIETVSSNPFYTVSSIRSYTSFKQDFKSQKTNHASRSEVSDVDFTSGRKNKDAEVFLTNTKLNRELNQIDLSNIKKSRPAVDLDCSCPCHRANDQSLWKNNHNSFEDLYSGAKKKTDILTTRRESIKQLMKTKMVSENKQKKNIENHIVNMMTARSGVGQK